MGKLSIDFPQLSRAMLKGMQSAKMAIRLLKQERDEKGGPFLKLWSHALKTSVLQRVLENPDPAFWHEGKLPQRFEELRSGLQAQLEHGDLRENQMTARL